MQELDLTWHRTMRMWWFFVWRGFVGGVIICAIAGFPQFSPLVAKVVGYPAGVVWSLFVLRMMVRKKYSDFSLALVPVAPSTRREEHEHELPPPRDMEESPQHTPPKQAPSRPEHEHELL